MTAEKDLRKMRILKLYGVHNLIYMVKKIVIIRIMFQFKNIEELIWLIEDSH